MADAPDDTRALKLLGFDDAPTPAPVDTARALDLLGMGAPPAVPELSDTGARTEMLRAREADPPIDMSPVAQELRQITANSLEQSDSRTAMDYLRVFQKAGIAGAFDNATAEAIEDTKGPALKNYAKFMTTLDLDRVGGRAQNLPNKIRIRKGMLAAELLKRMPLGEGDTARLSRAAVLHMADQRMAEEFKRAQNSGGAGKELAEQRYQELLKLRQLPEEFFDRLYAYSLQRTHSAPANSQEAALLEAPGEWYAQGNAGTAINQFERIMGGPEAWPMLRDEMVQRKTAYQYARVGLVAPDLDTVVPGYTVDGMNFTPFVPTGAVEELVAQRAAQDAAGDPNGDNLPKEAQASLLRIRQEAGPEAAAQAHKQIVQDHLMGVARGVADLASQPDMVEPPLTATERAYTNWATAALEGMTNLFGRTTELIEETDKWLSQSRWVREGLIQGLVRKAGGDVDQAARTHTLAEAFSFFAREGLNHMQDLEGALQERAKDLGLNLNDPEVRKLITGGVQDRGAAVRDYYKYGYELQDQRRKFLGDVISGKLPLLPNLGKVLGYDGIPGLIANMLVQGSAEQLAMVVDNPHEALGLAAGGKLLHATAFGPGTRAIDSRLKNVLYAWRLKNHLSDAITLHPETLKRFQGTARNLVRERGLTEGRLNDFVAATEAFLKTRDIEGVKRSAGEAAAIVRRAWPELKDGLGDFGYAAGTKMIGTRWTQEIARLLGDKTPNPEVSMVLGGNHTEKALQALQDMLGSRGDATVFESQYRQFVEANQRVPGPAEVRAMLPENMLDLHNLMVSAEKHGLQDPTLRKVFATIFRRPIEDFGKLALTAEQVMNEYVQGTLGLIDSSRRWGLARERSSLIVDTARRRLDNHAQQLELELDTARSRLNTAPTKELAEQLRAAEAEHFRITQEVGLLDKAQDHISRHNPSEPWHWPRELRQILFAGRGEGSIFPDGVVSGETLSLMLEMHPALFDGVLPESLWQTKRGALPKSVLEGLGRQSTGLKADIDAARAGVKAAKDPAAKLDAQARLDVAVEAHKQHMAMAAARKKEGVPTRTLDPRQYVRVLRMALHDGLTDAAKQGVHLLEKHRGGVAAFKELGLYANPYNPLWLPSTQKTRLVHDAIQAGGWRSHAALQRAEDFADFVNRSLSQTERDMLGEAQRTGDALPSSLREKYPKLQELYKDANALNTQLKNIDDYFTMERGAFTKMWDLMASTGRIPEHVMADFRRLNLDPRLFGAFERPGMVTSKRGKAAMEDRPALGESPEMGTLARDQSEWQFRREPGKYRVRVVEPNQVVNKLFDTRAELNEFMAETYGADAWKKIGGAKNGVQSGKTIYNEDITVGHPLTEGERAVWDEMVGHTPEARLESLRRGLQDAYTGLLAEALNVHGGFVLDPKEYLAFVGDNTARKAQYDRVSESAQTFGPLAGKWVHKKLRKELNDAAKTFETIHGLTQGYMDAIENPAPASSFGELGAAALRQTGNALRWSKEFTKNNVILKSLRTWGVNWTFNVLGDFLSGARAFNVEDIGHMFRKVVSEHPGKRAPIDVLRDTTLQEAREHGLVGGLFEADNEAFRDMKRRVFLPEDKAGLDALLAKRKALYDEMRRVRLAGGGGETDKLLKLENDLVAIREEVANRNRGWLRTTGRKLAHTWLSLATKDNLGRPTSPRWHNIRRFYNHIDESMRLMQYSKLRENGLPPELAAARVLRFNQNYSALPGWVRYASKSPFGSLVTSFPYEAGRIGGNAMLYQPARFLSFSLMLPFLNLMNMSSAGIDWDRAMAMLEARGQKGTLGATWSLFTDLYLTDPTTRSISGSIGLGNMLPFAGLLQGKGALSRAFDLLYPPEQRGLAGEAMGMGVAAISNFYGSSPLFNQAMYLVAGTDPLTGQQLTSVDMPFHKKLKVVAKQLAMDTLPPQLPFGRDWDAYERSEQAGVSERTGRLRGADELTTVLARGLTGVTVRGTVAQKLGAMFGIGTRAKDPTLVSDDDLIMKATYDAAKEVPYGTKKGEGVQPRESEENDLREYLNRSIDNSLTPSQRETAAREARKLSREMHEFDVSGMRGATSMTDREFRLLKRKVLEGGVADYFAQQPPHVQAVVLANLDQWNVSDDRMRELISYMKWSDTGHMRWSRDPEMIQYAIDFLGQRIADPAHNRRLDELVQHLKVVKSVAGMNDKIDQIRDRVRKNLTPKIREAVK